MSNGTAIPTIYQQVKFTTRRDARWAVFLDTIGWQWAYEGGGLAIRHPKDGIYRVILMSYKSPPNLDELLALKKLSQEQSKVVLWARGLPKPANVCCGLDGYYPGLGIGGAPRFMSPLMPLSKWAFVNYGLNNRVNHVRGVDRATKEACALAKQFIFEEI